MLFLLPKILFKIFFNNFYHYVFTVQSGDLIELFSSKVSCAVTIVVLIRCVIPLTSPPSSR